jgi:undecaprenyl pyrophosphate synthase
LPLVGNPEARLKQLEVGKLDAKRRKEEKALKAETQKLQKAAAAQTAKELRALAARPAAVKAEAEAKSDERLAVFMKWVTSKLVELTNSAKVAGRPAEELEEIVQLTEEELKAQLQTKYFDPVSTAVNSIIDAFVELQTGVAHLSSSAGATDTIQFFVAFDKRLDDLTTLVKSLADVVHKTVVPVGKELAEAKATHCTYQYDTVFSVHDLGSSKTTNQQLLPMRCLYSAKSSLS